MFRFTLFFSLLMGCPPHDGFFGTDGGDVSVGGEGNCIEVSTKSIDFGRFDLNTPPDSISIFIDTLCGENTTDFWVLDDPDAAFAVDWETDGDTVILEVNTQIEEVGTWESQIIVTDASSLKEHRVQIFAEALEGAQD